MSERMGEEARERVRDATDIVQLIGEKVQLRRAGRSFKGLCPFHTEKTPSFTVTPDRQIWHCFGC
ncbi:MAG TPA: CHC2 zinc finger domain-containing protein, partial [Candidatus Angelobacter sp.]|nr:CHC2 zinc finger domain-containing protein [Candidatus Angelobacter sp.]